MNLETIQTSKRKRQVSFPLVPCLYTVVGASQPLRLSCENMKKAEKACIWVLSWEPWATSLKYLADKMDSPCWFLYEEHPPTSAHHIRLPHSLGWEQVVAAPCSALQRTEGGKYCFHAERQSCREDGC